MPIRFTTSPPNSAREGVSAVHTSPIQADRVPIESPAASRPWTSSGHHRGGWGELALRLEFGIIETLRPRGRHADPVYHRPPPPAA